MITPGNILIIDDDEGMCETLGDVLHARGHAVQKATRGGAGLDELRGHAFDVVIVDIKLPDISGLELLRAIRQSSPDTEVIFITGHASLTTALQAINGAAFAYMVKPFEMDQLVAIVGKAIEKYRLTRALRESEERYRLITENINDAVFLLDPEGRLVFANARGETITGYRIEEFRGRSLDALLTPEGARDALARLEAFRAGRPVAPSLETEVVRKDGSRLWVEVNFTSILNDAGILGHIGVARDITERKQGEAELRTRAAQQAAVAALGQRALGGAELSTIFEEAVALVASTLGVEYCKVLELLPEEEALLLRAGVGWREGLVGRVRVGMGSDSQAGYTLLTDEPVVVEDLGAETRFSGPPLLLEHGVVSGLSVVIPGDGRPFGVLGAHTARRRDFSAEDVRFLQSVARLLAVAIARRRAEDALQERETRYRLVTLATNDAVWDWNLLTNEIEWGEGVQVLFGYGADEVGPDFTWWAERVHPDDRERVLAEVDAVVVHGAQHWSGEYRFRCRDGSYSFVFDRGYVVHDDKGKPIRMIGAMADLTQRRRAEEALRQSEKLAAMGSLLAGVAHELNNPLSVVLGQAALLSATVQESPLAERAEKIVRAAERCARIVRNFLALARQRPPERQRVQVNRLVQEAVELLAYPLRVDDVEVVQDLAPGLPELWADPHQLHQVIVNLVTNAHHAMRQTPPPRRLTFMTRFHAPQKRVSLTVGDTGPGIPPEVQAHIFEPFFTTKAPGEGTGLGLSLCQRAIEEHGGSIGIESRRGERGAVFRIELPVEAPPVLLPEARPSAERRPVRDKTVLVVDDEPEIAQILADLLAEDGHRVDVAPSGIAALTRLAERAYDLILSDVRMPELDGPGLYREVERRYPHLRCRFVFVTGDALGPETREFFARVDVPGLGKPFALDEVRRVVRQVLGPG